MQCLAESGSTPSGHHRHSSSANIGASGAGGLGSSAFSNWTIPCPRKFDRSHEVAYLELLVQKVRDCASDGVSTKKTTNEESLTPEGLMMVRLAEFMQLSWASGRIWNVTLGRLFTLVIGLRLYTRLLIMH